MKPGSNDPFEDDADDEPEDERTDEEVLEENTLDATAAVAGTLQSSDLPYKYQRDSVQDQRKHGNIFLREHAEGHVEDLIDDLEATFDGEDVFKIDVLEAAILAAGTPSTVEDELREMGYGMK